MNIAKALSHFEWKLVEKDEKGNPVRLKKYFTPSKKDVEAYNAILDYKEQQESVNMSQNESLAKLFIHQLLLLNNTQMYSAKRSIEVIHEILDKSLYEWCLHLQKNIGLMHLDVYLGENKEYCEAVRNSNVSKMQEIHKEEIYKNNEKMKELFNTTVSEDKMIKFVEQQINYIINKYEK